MDDASYYKNDIFTGAVLMNVKSLYGEAGKESWNWQWLQLRSCCPVLVPVKGSERVCACFGEGIGRGMGLKPT